MSGEILYPVAGVILFFMGVYGLVAETHLVKKVISFNIMGNGVFLMLIGFANRASGPPDPVPHALVLTGIVVTVSVTGFALMLIKRIVSEAGRQTPDRDE